jgi:predicted ATPase
MLSSLNIRHFKSLLDIQLEVARCNILIGDNGSGKSNILEAIALAAAAASQQLDQPALAARGIRQTEPKWLHSAFSAFQPPLAIHLAVQFSEAQTPVTYNLHNDAAYAYSKWYQTSTDELKQPDRSAKTVTKLNATVSLKQKIEKIVVENGLLKKGKTDLQKNILKFVADVIAVDEQDVQSYYAERDVHAQNARFLQDFKIFAPEVAILSRPTPHLSNTGLASNGAGLYPLLQQLQQHSAEHLLEIRNSLKLFDWYQDLHLPANLSQDSQQITLLDRYLAAGFAPGNANQGFLLMLFYMTLLVADSTPKIFAIENIEQALSPKLCTKLVKEMLRLAKKYQKQFFLTTHSPAVLDALNLHDDEQRLIVVARNRHGHTRCERIGLHNKPLSIQGEELKLSTAFLKGYLGGVPKGF